MQVRQALLMAMAALEAARTALKAPPSGDEGYEWRLSIAKPGTPPKKEQGSARGKLPAVLAMIGKLRLLRLQGYQAQAAIIVPIRDNGLRDDERVTERVDLELLTKDQRAVQMALMTGKGLKPLSAAVFA